jgi:hypothetical protein
MGDSFSTYYKNIQVQMYGCAITGSEICNDDATLESYLKG